MRSPNDGSALVFLFFFLFFSYGTRRVVIFSWNKLAFPCPRTRTGMGKPRGAEGKRKGQGGHHKEQTVILRLIAQRTRNLFVSWDTCSVPSQSARHREYWNILARSCLPPTFKGHGWGGGLSSLLSAKVRAHHRNMGSERARAREREGGEVGKMVRLHR